MASRRSTPSSGRSSHGRVPGASPPTFSSVVQSNVTQFFSATPAAASNPTSQAARSTQRITHNSAAARGSPQRTTQSISSSPARNSSSTQQRPVGPTTMDVDQAPSRDDPADPILDSSPHVSALAPSRPPRSPPNSRARRSASRLESSSGRGTPRRSSRNRRSASSAPSSPSQGLPATGRGGRSSGRSPFNTGRAGRGGRSPASRQSRSSSPADVPMVEARLVTDGVTTRSQSAASAVSTATALDAVPPSTLQALPRRAHSSSSSQPSTTSPHQGSFQALLNAEVQALQERTRQEDVESGVDAATAPPPDTEAGTTAAMDVSDAITVATDNTEGSFTQLFVNQPVAISVPAEVGTAQPPTSIVRAQPRAPSRTVQQANPYLRTELLPTRPIEVRYEMRLQLAPSSNADAELRATLVAFFAKIKEYDASLVIHPWSDRDNTTQQNGSRRWRAISKPDDIPATMEGLRRYFPRALPRPTGGFVYPSVHLGHSRTFEDLKTDLSWWFQSERHGLWTRQLQCESTYIVGWGLNSLQSIDIPALKKVLEEALGFPLGIRWRTIQTGQSGSIPADQMAKALHFEVNRTHKREAKRRLADLYARTATAFPLGIKMRLVWPLSDVMNLRTREKVAALRLRQLQFCTHMRGMRTWELHSIDQPDQETQFTLRSRLMAIRSSADGHQLFHTVDPSHVGEGAMQFAFHPAREDEARAMIIALIPYLRWKMAQEVPDLSDVERERFFARSLYCHFSKDALDRAVGAVWNPTTMTVDSPADDYNGWVFDSGDGELDCSGFGDDATPASTLATSVTRSLVRPHDAAGDTDSVSTLPQGTSLASTASTGSRSTNTRDPPDPGAATTASSLSSPSVPPAIAPALTGFLTSLQSVISSLPDTPQTQDLRSQLAQLTNASALSFSSRTSPSAPTTATGQDH